jgi:hypothetical protein
MLVSLSCTPIGHDADDILQRSCDEDPTIVLFGGDMATRAEGIEVEVARKRSELVGMKICIERNNPSHDA